MLDRSNSTSVFKIDRFTVPAAGREEFLGRIRSIRDFLDTMEGCVQNLVLEQPGGVGESTIMTIVEWRDAEVFAQARAAAAARYKASGFNPQELIARLGIKAEMANYGLLG